MQKLVAQGGVAGMRSGFRKVPESFKDSRTQALDGTATLANILQGNSCSKGLGTSCCGCCICSGIQQTEEREHHSSQKLPNILLSPILKLHQRPARVAAFSCTCRDPAEVLRQALWTCGALKRVGQNCSLHRLHGLRGVGGFKGRGIQGGALRRA